MWSDNETAIDLLNIEHYVSTVIELATDETLLPVTIGVFGDWGNGKSSLLQMVKKKLVAEDKVVCLYFNGWLFEDYDDAKAALMGTILDEIEKSPKFLTSAKKTLDNLRKKVNWLGLMGVAGKYGMGLMLGGPVGGIGAIAMDVGQKVLKKVTTGKVTDTTQKIFNDSIPDSTQVRKNIQEFKEEFPKLLEESKIEKLVVIIDDLDRCLPDTIINTLEAIKLFLTSKNTSFLISIDERVIKYAITDRYNKFDSQQKESISRDYLEKLIQIPLRIPLMSKSEMKSYINLLFASKHLSADVFTTLLASVNESRKGSNFNVGIDLPWFKKNSASALGKGLDEELMITEQINDLLYDFLKGNPRQVKRFINALLLRIKLAQLRGVTLKKQVLAKLMALEYMKIDYFKTLADWQSLQNGQPKEIKELESVTHEKDEDEYKKWTSDPWIRKWLNTEPKLGDENLESYFYISRDSLSHFSTPSIELSETEQAAFDELVSGSEAHKIKGKDLFKNLTEQEASRIVRVLVERQTKIDPDSDDGDLVALISSLPNLKREVSDDVISFLTLAPEKSIPPAVVAEIKGLQKSATGDLKERIDSVLEKFKKSTINKQLAKAVDL